METKTEAELAVEAEAKAKAEADAQDEFEVSLEGLSEEEKTQKRTEKANVNIKSEEYYQLEIEKERKMREKAEKAAADNAFKLREAKRNKEEEDGAVEKPLTASELQEILSKDREDTRKESLMIYADEKIRKLTSSDSEASLVKEVLKNRSFPESLSLDDRIEESFAIANRKKLIAERNEALRALKSRETNETFGGSTFHDQKHGQEPRMAQDEKVVLTQGGFSFNNASRQWEKKIKGKVLFYDTKLKQVRPK